MIKNIYNTVVFALIFVFLWNIFSASNNRNSGEFLKKPVDMPVIFLDAVEGAKFNLLSVKENEVSIIKFYASWCGYCVSEMPILNEIKNRKIATIYGIAVKDNDQKLKKMFMKYGNPFDFNGMDKNRVAMREFRILGLPSTVIVDKNMKIRYVLMGALDKSDIDDKIIPAINRIKNENNQKYEDKK